MKSPQNGYFYTFALLLGLSLVLTGCGQSVSDRISEKASEKIIESATGGKVDVDNGNVQIKTDKGTMTAGDGVQLPDSFPKDVYVIEGKITSAVTTPDEGFSVSIESGKGVAEATKLYGEKLKSNGWKILATMDLGESGSVTAEKGNRSAAVFIGKSDDKSTVVLTVGKK
jgi:hypothetical protein